MYVLTFILSVYYIKYSKIEGQKAFLWKCITLFLLVMVINKQLDIQILISMIGRFTARHLNLYHYRRDIYAAVILILLISMIVLLIFVFIKTKSVISQSRLALSGVILLMVFVLVRASRIWIPKVHGMELSGLILIFIDLCLSFKRLQNEKKE
jgi:hypothetical protein